jgi:hypothetical protein
MKREKSRDTHLSYRTVLFCAQDNYTSTNYKNHKIQRTREKEHSSIKKIRVRISPEITFKYTQEKKLRK